MNSGKIFENEIKDSVANHNKKINDDIYLLRLPDSASGFGMDSLKTRFSSRSEFDFLMYKDNVTIAIELKSSGKKSISFSTENNKKEIKACQIESLKKCDFYGIKAGFLINFRIFPETYFLDIKDFCEFISSTKKKSISRDDVVNHHGIIIPQRLKKVKHIYEIEKLFEEDEDED